MVGSTDIVTSACCADASLTPTPTNDGSIARGRFGPTRGKPIGRNRHIQPFAGGRSAGQRDLLDFVDSAERFVTQRAEPQHDPAVIGSEPLRPQAGVCLRHPVQMLAKDLGLNVDR